MAGDKLGDIPNNGLESAENGRDSNTKDFVDKVSGSVHGLTSAQKDEFSQKLSTMISSEKMDMINSNLGPDQLITLGLEALADERMTSSKIITIGFMFGPEDINIFRIKRILELSDKEFDSVVRENDIGRVEKS